MIKKYGDLWAGIAIALFSIVIFIASGYIRQRANMGLGAAFMPRLVAGIMLALSIMLMVRGIRAARAYTDNGEKAAAPAYGVLAGSFLLMVAYTALLSKLGFIITTTVYLFLQILLVSRKEQVHYIKFAVISVASAVGIYLLFVNVFSIMIPAGILG